MLQILATALLAAAPQPWDAAPFSASPAELAAAARKLTVEPGQGSDILVHEESFVLDAQGRIQSRTRLVYRLLTREAVQHNGLFKAGWEPWYQDRPSLRLRVVTPAGQAHELDPATVSEAPEDAGEHREHMVQDGRELVAPLPGVEPGAVVEAVIDLRDREVPVEGIGAVRWEQLSTEWYTPRRFTVRVDAPAGLPVHAALEGAVDVRRERTEGGRRVLEWSWEPAPRAEPAEEGEPLRLTRAPYLAFSTGGSWESVAAAYRTASETQLAGADLGPLARELARGAKDRDEAALRVLAYVREKLRYTAVELGRASLVPVRPADVLARRYGDCKDLSLLFVGLMRALGYEADLTLVRVGSDARADLPGLLGMFDHAIVRLGGAKPAFVDPTWPVPRVGHLGPGVDGRLALVIRPGVKGLERLPTADVADYQAQLDREILLRTPGAAELHDRRLVIGAEAAESRHYRAVTSPEELRKRDLEDARERCQAQDVTIDARELPDGGLEHRWTAKGSRLGEMRQDDAEAHLFPRLPRCLPDELLPPAAPPEPGKAPRPERKKPLEIFQPCAGEQRYRIVPRPGFRPVEPLPAGFDLHIGLFRYSLEVHAGEEGVVEATYRLSVPRGVLAPDEVNRVRAFLTAQPREGPRVSLERTSRRLLAAGRGREALAELRRVQALAGSPDERVRLAFALMELGLGEAARAEVQAAAAAPGASAWPRDALTVLLAYDPMGRWLRAGCDWKGAVAAARRSLAAGETPQRKAALGTLLLQGEDCRLLGPGAAPAEAEPLLRAAADGGVAEAQADLLQALLANGKAKDAAALARGLEPGPDRNALLLVAVARAEGPSAAAREAGRLTPRERREALQAATQRLVAQRAHGEAAALLEAASGGAEDAAGLRARAALLRGAVPLAGPGAPGPEDPRTPLAALLRFRLGGAPAGEVFAASRDDAARDPAALVPLSRGWELEGAPPAAAAEVLLGRYAVQAAPVEGNARKVTAAGPDGALTVYLAREGGRWRVVALGGEPEQLARRALLAMDRQDPAEARRFLAWAEAEAEGGRAATPAAAGAITEGERLAAAMLAAPASRGTSAVVVLERAWRSPPARADRRTLARALARAYHAAGKDAELLVLAAALEAELPEVAAVERLRALAALGRAAEARQAAGALLASAGTSAGALREAGLAALDAGLAEDAVSLLSRAGELGALGGPERARLAWARLFLDGPVDAAVADANRALAGEAHAYATLHAAAAVLAAAGEPARALRTLEQAVESGAGRVTPAEELVLGLLAEAYGEPDAARAAYRKVAPDPRAGGASPWHLAQARLRRLDAAAAPIRPGAPASPAAAPARGGAAVGAPAEPRPARRE